MCRIRRLLDRIDCGVFYDQVLDSNVAVDCDVLPQRPGYRTVQFLFEFGIKCLEKYVYYCSSICSVYSMFGCSINAIILSVH